jgi:iron complex outermembrane receptor protein
VERSAHNHSSLVARKLSKGVALPALALALLTGGPALAQAESDAEVESASIVVTGTRIKQNGFNEATPVTVMGSAIIANLGQVNAGEVLKLMPTNSAFQSDAVAGITAGSNVGASFANLRGLNPANGTRTLTLVNTRRFVPTSDGGAVDLNLIPTAMIDRVETVTGGASAAYGSDAIAGVVNILLNTKLEGIRAQADFGQTMRGDGKSYHASLVYGRSFADGRGHVVIGGEWQKNEGIGDCYKVRDWCAEGWDIFTNASTILPGGGISGYNVPGSPGDALPNFIVGPNSRQSYNDPRGVVRDRAPAAAAARNFRFTDDGKGIVQFDPGQYVSSSLTGARQGGDGVSTYDDSDIQTPLKRYVGYLYGSYELSDDVTLSTELTYARREAQNVGVTVGPRSTFFVRSVNAYLPTSLVTLLNGTSFSLGKDLDGQIETLNAAQATVFRGLVGLNWQISDSWALDSYYQYGRNKRHQDRTNVRVNTPFQFALDAVNDGSGNIVCAELLKASPSPLAQGCVPFNLFGSTNVLDPRAVAYAYRPVMEDYVYSQHVISAAVSGELFQGFGAGPVGVAGGVEYRAESGDVTHGEIANLNDFAFSFGLDFGGKINVFEAFTEVNVPILRDSALGDRWELNGAVRFTRNSAEDIYTDEKKSSDILTWKLTSVYDVTNGIRLRASRSRDIRAAGFRELYLRNVPTESGSSLGIVDNPNIPGSPAGGDDWTPILNGGSFALSPEKADTTTFGVVFQPDFIPRLRFSVDWYKINVTDAIITVPGQRIVDYCHQFSLFCERITRTSATDITFVDARQVNLGRMTVRGYDFEVDYTLPLSEIAAEWKGSLNMRVLANHQYDFIVQPNPSVPSRDYAGQSGPVLDGGDFNPAPPWIWNGFLTYDSGPFNTTLSVRRVSKGILNVERTGPEDAGYDPNKANSISTNRVDGATYFGIAMSYKIPLGGGDDRHVQVFGTIDNLFDKKPPVAPGGGGLGGSNYPTNPVYFDTFGSRFRAGLRVRY